jgi:hypothetical protein
MKKIIKYISLWQTLFLSSVIIIIYLVTVQLTEALSYSSAGVVYFNQPNAEITWEPSQGPVSHYLLSITDTQFLSMKNSKSTIKTVKEIRCRKPPFDIACANNHSYQVSVKAVSYGGLSSEYSPPSILFISDQTKPEIFPDPLPSPEINKTRDIAISGRYSELNLDFIQVNDSQADLNPIEQTFKGEVKLEEGWNTISIVAHDLAGNSSRKDLEVFYLAHNTSFLQTQENLHPFAVDYNGDDIVDLLLGTGDGKIVLYVNQGDNENPLFSDYTYLTTGTDATIVDIGERAVPCMADLNGDGLNDLLVGCGEGYLYYAENQGNSRQPHFNPIEILEDISNQQIRVEGNCNPIMVDWDGNGINDILLGSDNGSILILDNQGDINDIQLASASLLEIDGVFLNVAGTSKPFVADWDNDGGKDLLVGDEAGYLHIYLNSVESGVPELVWEDKIKIPEHAFVLERELKIPYFAGMSMMELIL